MIKAAGFEGGILGHIEANEGYFHGELESGPLKVDTDPLYIERPNYSAGASVTTLMSGEFAFWGKSWGGNSPATIDKAAVGYYGSKAISRINIYDQGRAGVQNISGVTFTFSDGSTSGLLLENTTLTQGLSGFRYKTEGWMVRLTNIPLEDPKIAGIVWRNGTSLMISNG